MPTKTTVRNELLSVGLLSGTIIGAGVFSLPYIFKTAGLVPGFFYLVLAAAAYSVIHLMFAKIIQSTPGEHRFVGYARIYLGRGAGFFSVFMTVIETIFVLTIYLILSQSFINLVVPAGAWVEKLIVFWVLSSAAIFLGVRRIAWLELLITGGIIGVIFLIFLFGIPKLGTPGALDLGAGGGWRNFLLPLAPVLFSMSGRQAIPALLKVGGSVKKAIIAGTVLPALVYILFVVSILALSPVVTEDAVTGLVGAVPGAVLVLVGIFGILSLVSSYITVGFDVYKSLELDFRFPFWLKFLIVILGPIALYFAGFTSFIVLVSFVGGIFLALEGIFITLMWLKATKRSLTLPIILLIAVFAAALVYEIIK